MTDHIQVEQDLTDYDVNIYEALRQAWNDFGLCPSYEQLQHACLCSAPTVRKAVTKLRAKGLITARKYQVRSLKPTDLDRRLVNKPPDPWADLAPPKKYFKASK